MNDGANVISWRRVAQTRAGRGVLRDRVDSVIVRRSIPWAVARDWLTRALECFLERSELYWRLLAKMAPKYRNNNRLNLPHWLVPHSEWSRTPQSEREIWVTHIGPFCHERYKHQNKIIQVWFLYRLFACLDFYLHWTWLHCDVMMKSL